MPHCGVAVDDPRNAGVIEIFRPKPVTRESRLDRRDEGLHAEDVHDVCQDVNRIHVAIAYRRDGMHAEEKRI